MKNYKPYGNFSKSMTFSEKVRTLQRPYTTISSDDYDALYAFGVDVLVDEDGLLFTYGEADGGYAIMPIQSSAKSLIDKVNPV